MLCRPLAVSCPPHTSEVCTINTPDLISDRDSGGLDAGHHDLLGAGVSGAIMIALNLGLAAQVMPQSICTPCAIASAGTTAAIDLAL